MNRFHFQDEEAPAAQRMTNEEAEAIIRLWAERERLSSLPTVQDVADGLQIPVQEAAGLLQEVRANRARQTRETAQRAVPSRRKLNPLIVAATAAGTLVLLFVTLGLVAVQPVTEPMAVPVPPIPPAPAAKAKMDPADQLKEAVEQALRAQMQAEIQAAVRHHGMEEVYVRPPVTDPMPRVITPMTR